VLKFSEVNFPDARLHNIVLSVHSSQLHICSLLVQDGSSISSIAW